MAERPVLDLTSETARPIVRIDGVPYELRGSRDLTLQDFKLLERVSVRIGELMLADTLSKKEDAELAARLRDVAAIALEAPASVLAGLTDIQRVLIFKVFTELLTPGLQLAARAIQTPGRSPGEKHSPAFSGSTAGRPKAGSRGRRSGSSRPH